MKKESELNTLEAELKNYPYADQWLVALYPHKQEELNLNLAKNIITHNSLKPYGDGMRCTADIKLRILQTKDLCTLMMVNHTTQAWGITRFREKMKTEYGDYWKSYYEKVYTTIIC